MKRSAGVTAVAVVAIIEGILVIVFGALALLGLVMMRVGPQRANMPESIFPAEVMLGIEGLLFIGIGAWTIASAVGILRLKNWARISICVLGGVLAAFSLFGVLGAALVASMPLPSTPGREVPPGFMTAFAWGMAAVCFLQMAVGIWWLVFLNRRAVKEQFWSGGAAPIGSGRPVSITIIAWLMVIGGLFAIPFSFLQKYPALLFGMLISGWLGKVFYLVFLLAYLGAGIGLLQLKPLSRTLAVWVQIFALANVTANFLVPDAIGKYMTVLQESLPKEQQGAMGMMSGFMWFGLLFGALAAGLQLYFLISRKEAFLAAANSAQNRLPAM